MKKIAIALLATSILSAPAAFAASNDYQQQPQKQQTQKSRDQSASNQQNQQSRQNQQNAQAQQNQQSDRAQQSAENNQSNNEPMSPQSLSRSQIRKVQQALDKDGFKAGRADGRWGRETENAVKQFQQSKQLQATGQLDQQTIADLGLDQSKFSSSQDQQK